MGKNFSYLELFNKTRKTATPKKKKSNHSGDDDDYSYSSSFWEDFYSQEETDTTQKSCIIKPDFSRLTASDFLDKYDNYKKNHKLKTQNSKDIMTDDMFLDLAKMYYNKQYEFNMNSKTVWWYKLLSRMDNFLLKMCTNTNSAYTSIISQRIAHRFIELIEEEMKQTGKSWSQMKKEMNDQMSKEMQDMLSEADGDQSGEGSGESEGKGKGKKGEGEGEGEEEQDGDQSTGQLPGKGDGQGQKYSGLDIDSMMKKLDKAVEKAIKEAEKEIEELEIIKKEYGINTEGFTQDQVHRFKDLIKKTNVSRKSMNKFIKKSINKICNEFNGSNITIEENIMQADTINEIKQAEYLTIKNNKALRSKLSHPDALAMLMEEVTVKTNKKSIVFDIYVDSSGSMSSSTYFLKEGKNPKDLPKTGVRHNEWFDPIERSFVATVFTLKVNGFNMLNDVYIFESTVHPITHEKIIEIPRMGGGGTCTDNCIRNIIKSGNPSIIITDGDDSVSIYNPNTYIIAIDHIHYMRGGIDKNNALVNYVQNKQYMIFTSGRFVRPTIHALEDGIFDSYSMQSHLTNPRYFIEM